MIVDQKKRVLLDMTVGKRLRAFLDVKKKVNEKIKGKTLVGCALWEDLVRMSQSPPFPSSLSRISFLVLSPLPYTA